MNTILQDIIGLFTRKKIITGKQLKDNDYLAVAEIKSRNVGVPSQRDVKLIKVSEIVPAPKLKRYSKSIEANPSITLNLDESDHFFLDATAVFNNEFQQPVEITLTQTGSGFIGVKHIYITYNSNFSGEWVWTNVKWPSGETPTFSVGNNGVYDLVTITGKLPYQTKYMGTVSLDHKDPE